MDESARIVLLEETEALILKRNKNLRAEVDRLTKALNDIWSVPWTSSGRGDISTEEQYRLALIRIEAITRTALGKDEHDNG